MNFKSLGLGIALSCGTVALGNSLTMSPVQAFSLNGTVSVQGPASLGPVGNNPGSTAISWLNSINQPKVNEATGDFAGLINRLVTIQDLPLTRDGSASNQNTYRFGAVPNFINFGSFTINGETRNLSFNLNAGELVRSAKPNTVSVDTSNNFPFGISGAFLFGSETVAIGELNGNRSFGTGSSGTTTISLTAQPVPEPLTILGSATALGIGAVLKKKSTKKQNKEKAMV
jgi:hypothetical protein